MSKKVQRLTVFLFVVSLCTLLFSSAVLAQESQSASGRIDRSHYHQLWKLLQLKNRVTLLIPALSVDPVTDSVPPASISMNPDLGSDTTTDLSPDIDSPPATPAVPVTEQPVKPDASDTQPVVASQSDYAAEVVRLVNVERAKNSLAPLTADDKLRDAAQVRAKELNSLFSHIRPNGDSCFSVLSEQGISYRSAAENIAIGQVSPERVVQSWMESPGHRANILGDYTKIGIGWVEAGGQYRGCAWAQLFTQ